MYKRFWFEFDNTTEFPQCMGIGCGVTAIDYNDAIKLIEKSVLNNNSIPTIKKVIENVDIRDLDQLHVIPNMESPNLRGIWFPRGYNSLVEKISK